MSAENVDLLARQWQEAKKSEMESRDERLKLEEQIIGLVGAKIEGATSVKTKNYKITTTGKMTRRVNEEKLEEFRNLIPDAIFNKVFSFTPKLNTKALKSVQDIAHDTYKILAQTFVSKPAKTAISVSEIGEIS